jgi:hypothetical protein
MPDTPEPSYSVFRSLSSSVLLHMPMGMVDDDFKIVILHDTYPGLSIVEQAVLNFSVMKQKIFAFPAPSKYYLALISS